MLGIGDYYLNDNYDEQLKLTGKSNIYSYGGESNTLDEQCNIYGMASNPLEWTTETCKYNNKPCCIAMGYIWDQPDHMDYSYFSIQKSDAKITFRPILYL